MTGFWKNLAFGVSAAALLAPAAAIAQEAVYRFDIPAQDLGAALRAYGQQSGQQLGFDAAITRGKQSSALVGGYSADEGLRRLLEGTGLHFARTAAGVLVVHDPASPTRLGDAEGAAPRDGEDIAEILVIGRPTLNADIRRSEDDIQPYSIITREEIERSGAANLSELIRREFTQERTSGTGRQQPGTGGPVTSVSFRGLDFDEVLVLVDGRRVASGVNFADFTQPNIDGIPLGAIERIEVLASTASAIHGGGATGGVINVILRRDYRGLELGLRGGGAAEGDGASGRIDLAAGYGFNGGDTNVLVALTRDVQDEILLGDRDVFQRYRARVLANAPATFINPFRLPAGTTPNIMSVSGAELTLDPAFGGAGLGSNMTFVPFGYAGPGSDNGAALIANAGELNFDVPRTSQFYGGGSRPLRPQSETQSIDVTLRHRFSPGIQGFAEIFYSENESEWWTSALSSPFMLAADDPGNPFAQDVAVSVPTYGADIRESSRFRDGRLVLGAIFDLPFEWRGGFDYTYGWSDREVHFTLGGASPDLNADIASGALDLFRDFTADGPVFAPYMLPLAAGGGEARADLFAFRAGGPLPLSILGNRATLSMLAEHREERVEESSFIGLEFPPRSQTADAIYAEISAPIITQANAIPGVRLLEFQLAARGDWYEIQSSSTPFDPPPVTETVLNFSEVSPTFGLRYQPIEDLMFRASYAEGFLPPSLGVLTPTLSFPFDGAFYGLTDPERGDEAIGPYDFIGGGNVNLRPERSETLTFGVILTPRFVEGLRLSLDWVRTDKVDGIENAFGVFSQESFLNLLAAAPERIIRDDDPSTFGPYGVGPVVAIDSSIGNIATGRFESIDLNLDQLIPTELGEFTLSARASYQLTQDLQLSPVAPILEVAGISVPQFIARATLAWREGPWQASWTTRFFDDYRVQPFDEAAQGGPRVESQTYHDVYLSYAFSEAEAGWRGGLRLEAGITNLFDATPPVYVATGPIAGGYSQLGDASGANFYLGLRKQF